MQRLTDTFMRFYRDSNGRVFIVCTNGFEEYFFTINDLNNLKKIVDTTIDNYYDLKSIFDLETLFRDFVIEDNTSYVKKEKETIKGYVYIAKCNRTGHFKIGRTKNIESRISTLKLSNSSIELYKSFYVNDINIEKKTHAKFEEFRVGSEWFELEESQLNEVENFIKSFE